MGRKPTGRIKQVLKVSLAPETHTILNQQPNKSVAIDTAVQSYFTPIANGDGGFREKN